jgi:hypothetical protein
MNSSTKSKRPDIRSFLCKNNLSPPSLTSSVTTSIKNHTLGSKPFDKLKPTTKLNSKESVYKYKDQKRNCKC